MAAAAILNLLRVSIFSIWLSLDSGWACWVTTISATNHIGHDHIGHRRNRPQTTLATAYTISATSKVHIAYKQVQRLTIGLYAWLPNREMRKDIHHRVLGLATSSFTALLPNRSWAEIRRLHRVICKSCADKTLLMTWVEITKSKYRHVSMQVEQRTSSSRNYRSTVIWATNHAQCANRPFAFESNTESNRALWFGFESNLELKRTQLCAS